MSTNIVMVHNDFPTVIMVTDCLRNIVVVFSLVLDNLFFVDVGVSSACTSLAPICDERGVLPVLTSSSSYTWSDGMSIYACGVVCHPDHRSLGFFVHPRKLIYITDLVHLDLGSWFNVTGSEN